MLLCVLLNVRPRLNPGVDRKMSVFWDGTQRLQTVPGKLSRFAVGIRQSVVHCWVHHQIPISLLFAHRSYRLPGQNRLLFNGRRRLERRPLDVGHRLAMVQRIFCGFVILRYRLVVSVLYVRHGFSVLHFRLRDGSVHVVGIRNVGQRLSVFQRNVLKLRHRFSVINSVLIRGVHVIEQILRRVAIVLQTSLRSALPKQHVLLLSLQLLPFQLAQLVLHFQNFRVFRVQIIRGRFLQAIPNIATENNITNQPSKNKDC
jgi:hypothetical protein